MHLERPRDGDIDPYRELRTFVERFETIKAAAKSIGVAPQFLSDILKRRRQPTMRILKKLGLRVTVVRE